MKHNTLNQRIEPPQLIKLKRADENAPIPSKKSHTNFKKKSETPEKEEELDFVRVKPKDQVPILSFWTAVDPHFRPLEEADREFLLEKVFFLLLLLKYMCMNLKNLYMV